MHIGYNRGRKIGSLWRVEVEYLKVIRPSTEELIPYVQSFAAVYTAEEALAGEDAPGFVTNVYEDVVAAFVFVVLEGD